MTRLPRTFALVLVAAFGPIALAAESADTTSKKPANLPAGYKLVYSNDFDKADSLTDFQYSDPNAWRFSKEGNKTGALELHGKSKYKTKVRSPFNLAMIGDKQFGSFVLEADMQQTGREYGHRDMCVFFGFVDVDKYYYIHMASTPDPHAHNVFIVNEKPRKAIAEIPEKGVDWGQEKWHRVRIERDIEAGDIKLYFDGKLIHHTKDTTFKHGHIGFGSFDDTGKVDNVRIWGKEAKKVDAKLFE